MMISAAAIERKYREGALTVVEAVLRLVQIVSEENWDVVLSGLSTELLDHVRKYVDNFDPKQRILFLSGTPPTERQIELVKIWLARKSS